MFFSGKKKNQNTYLNVFSNMSPPAPSYVLCSGHMPSGDPDAACRSDLPNLLTVLTASVTGLKFSLSSWPICGKEHELYRRAKNTFKKSLLNDLRRDCLISNSGLQINRSTYFKEHSQGSNPPSFLNSNIQTLEVIWIVTVDLHLNESKR